MINSAKLKTSFAFAKNIKTTGAFRQTSEKVEKEICRYIDINVPQVIVELGTGHGNITKEILQRMNSSSLLYTFEVNEEFCAFVSSTIDDPRLHVINAGAERLMDYVDAPIDVVISSIPLTLFSKELIIDILNTVYKQLHINGSMSQILYSKLHKKKFEAIFDDVHVARIINIPMEYVHHCFKRRNEIVK